VTETKGEGWRQKAACLSVERLGLDGWPSARLGGSEAESRRVHKSPSARLAVSVARPLLPLILLAASCCVWKLNRRGVKESVKDCGWSTKRGIL